jgi:hypothetical protein
MEEISLKDHNLPLTFQWAVIDVFLMGFSNERHFNGKCD